MPRLVLRRRQMYMLATRHSIWPIRLDTLRVQPSRELECVQWSFSVSWSVYLVVLPCVCCVATLSNHRTCSTPRFLALPSTHGMLGDGSMKSSRRFSHQSVGTPPGIDMLLVLTQC